MITFDYITVFTAAQPVNKSVTINNGKPHKVMTSPQREMQARTVAVPDAEAFVEVLKEVGDDPCKCISLGFVQGTEDGQPYGVLSAKQLKLGLNLPDSADTPVGFHDLDGEQYCARSKSNFTQSSWVLFDKDTAPGQPDALVTEDVDEWLGWMGELIPGFAESGKVVVGSTSGRVLLDGAPAFTGGGLHCYVQISDPEDVPNFKRELLAHATGGPYGFLKPSFRKATGEVVSHQPWTIADVSVFSPERLVFDGAPVVKGEGLAVADTEVRVIDGGLLDLSLTVASADDLARCSAVH
ncbi:MAG: hypothetical protein HN842_10875, partial [Gammaproteobacteria bacterium]|nr:hypothetical protein [Gammaproteobacteria bacterium]